MFDFLSGLFDSDFMPHGYCYQWQPDILWLHVGSDALITLAYYAIPFALIYFVTKRRDLDFKGMFLLFGAFILLCGTTHLLEIWSVWHGTYRLTGVVKLLTAAVSVVTAVGLVPLVPKAVALPSPSYLRQINASLQQEIKERIKAQEELDRFFELSVDFLCIAGFDGYFKRINLAFSSVLGYPKDVLVRPLLDFVHPEDVATTRRQLKALAQGEPVITFEMRLRAANDTYRWVSWSAQPLLEENRFFAVGRDITEQREARERALMHTSLLQRAEELAHLGNWYIDVPTGKMEWSDEVFRIHALDPAQGALSLAEGFAYYHPDDQAYVQQVVQEAMEKGKGFEFETRLVRPSGEVRNVYAKGESITEEEGEVKAIFGVFMDITDRKQAEAEREALIAELEAKNAELERFTYTVSHDLKSPLVTIQGFTGMLRKDLGEGNTERINEDLQYIVSAADTMQTLLSELLDLSRVGRLVNHPEPVSLTDLAEATVAHLAGRVAERGAEVSVGASMPVVEADRVRLQEVLQNLIENALKFSRPGVAPHVEIGARVEGGEVLCWVRDNGVGIAPAYQERIFGLFERLDQKMEGTGIGLALAKRIVEVHSGRIWVESGGEGQGSTFYFTLPYGTARGMEA